MLERTLADRVRVLGAQHPDTVRGRTSHSPASRRDGNADDGRAERVDPITLIVTALAAGASSGAIQALQNDVKEKAIAAYGKLHDLVKRLYRVNAAAEVVLSEYQADPQTYAGGLTKKLTEAGAADDADLLAAAQALMDLVDRAGARAGKYNVTITNANGVQIGDNSIQVNRF